MLKQALLTHMELQYVSCQQNEPEVLLWFYPRQVTVFHVCLYLIASKEILLKSRLKRPECCFKSLFQRFFN